MSKLLYLAVTCILLVATINATTLYQDIYYISFNPTTRTHSFSAKFTATNTYDMAVPATYLLNVRRESATAYAGETVAAKDATDGLLYRPFIPNFNWSHRRNKFYVISDLTIVCATRVISFTLKNFSILGAANKYYATITSNKAIWNGSTLTTAVGTTITSGIADSAAVTTTLTNVHSLTCT